MIPEENEAVREAKRRRALAETAALHEQEENLRLHAVRRPRRYWIWMGLMPGLLAVPLCWMILLLGDKLLRPWQNLLMVAQLGMVLWVGYCSLQLVKTRREASLPERIGLGIGLFLLFGVVNVATFYALFLASCAVVVVLN